MTTVQGRNRRRGKNTERAVAKMFGGTRMGIFGRDDVRTDVFAIEVKDRKKCVVEGWMAQAVRNRGEKVPLVVIHITGRRHSEDMVVMRISDWEDWYGGLDYDESGEEG